MESEREREREFKICAAEKLLLVKILFAEASFKASFECREGRAVTDSERKTVISCSREAKGTITTQFSFNHIIRTRCCTASFGGLCLMHTPTNIDIAKYQTLIAALPTLLHYWDIIIPMSTIVLPHTPFMCSRHKPASSSMISFHLRHIPDRSRFNPPTPRPPLRNK